MAAITAAAVAGTAITAGTVAAGVATAATVAGVAQSRKSGKTAAKAAASQEAIMGRQQDIADEQWENYKKNYLPLEQEYLEKAKNFGSIANQEKAAANAAAASSAAFANAREELNRAPGLDPNSQQYLRTSAKIGLAEAANSAASQTAARENVEKTGAAMLQDAASMGKGMSSNAMASTNAAANSASNYANTAASRSSNSAAGLGNMVGGLYKSGAFDAIGNMFKPQVGSWNDTTHGSAF